MSIKSILGVYKQSIRIGSQARGHILAVITAICLMFVSNVHATLILDTGAGSTSGPGYTVFSDQSLAGQFTLTDSYTVSSVEGWFGKVTEGSVTAAIYTDNGSEVPISELFSQQFLLDTPSSGNNAWDGAYGLDWLLDAGTYWLAFEVRTADTGRGYMPYDSPYALDDASIRNLHTAGEWWNWVPQNIGMRIDSVAVPEPSIAILMTSGLLAFAVVRRKVRF